MLLVLLSLAACSSGGSGTGNQVPMVVDITLSTDEDTALGVTLSGNDNDGSISSYTINTSPTHGALSGTAPNLTYTPDANYNGSDSFTFTVTDNDAATSSVATVSITVNDINDLPVATAQSVNTNEDVAMAIILGGSDIDGTISSYGVGTPAHGVLSGTAPNLIYTPTEDYSGSDSFNFSVTDNNAAVSVTNATVSITIDPVNDTPSFVMGAYQGVNEDAGAQTIVGWASEISTGPANESGQTTSFLVTNDNNALFSVQPAISSDGTLSYTPTADAFGWVTLSVQLQDDGGTTNGGVDTTAAQTFTININPVNDLLSLSLTGLQASTGGTVQAALVNDNFTAAGMQYAWQASGDWSISSGQGTSLLDILAPANSSGDNVSLSASGTGLALAAVLPLSLSADPTPVLESLTFTPQPSVDTWQLATTANDPNTLALTYSWSSGGLAIGGSSDSLSWTPPLSGQYRVSVEASNGTQNASGTMEYFHTGAAPWAFFRGTREGSGSRFPVDTSNNTGQLKWKTTFTTQNCGAIWNFVSATAQGQDGTLYVGSYTDGKLYAFNPDSGEVKWSFDTAGSNIQSSPAVAADGTIYVAEHDAGTVYAVHPDGSQKWQYVAGANIVSPVAIGADGMLYVGTLNGASSVLVALNPADGSVKWTFALANTTRSSVNFGADGTVYARDYSGNLFAIDPADGSQKWQITRGPYSGSSPAVAADGTIYFGSYTGSTASRLYAANPANGSQLWESNLGGNLYGVAATASVGTDGTVYIGSREGGGNLGAVHALDSADGSVKWSHPLDYAASSTAIGADGTVYAASLQGTLYALDSGTGAEKWTYNTRQPGSGVNQNSPSPLTIGADGSIYAYTCEGVLHAIQ